MARKLRLDEEGGCCHVLNRGNYREWIFEDERTKEAYLDFTEGKKGNKEIQKMLL